MIKKSYSVLQKRLQKLESELTLAFSLPPQTLHDHHQISQYIEKRFAFLRKLLSAEIASHPKKPYHLHNINRRLKELETVFRQWDSSKSKALTLNDHFDPVPTCSCNETFVNDDGEASPPELAEKYCEDLVEETVHNMEHESWLNGGENASVELGSPGFEEAKKFFEGLNDEKAANGISVDEVGERDVKREEKRVWIGKHGGAMAAGLVLVLGMALLGLATSSLSGYFHYVEHNSLLKPT